jgi:hypothetical protein
MTGSSWKLGRVRDRELVGVLTMQNVGEFLVAHSALRAHEARATPAP